MKNETWKFVVGFENEYEVSDMGRVRSLDRVITTKAGTQKRLKGKLLTPLLSPYGYYYVHIHQKGYKIHRLVYEAFVGIIPNGGYHVHHLDGNKTNNTPRNLELLTHGQHSIITHTGRTMSEETKAKLRERNKGLLLNHKSTSKAICKYAIDGTYIETYPSTMEAQRSTGVLSQNIGACANGKNKTAGGYIWKYKNLNKEVTK